ncbi:MAG: hypothetical protein LKM34_09015 [Prevotella sp.]|jgi:hypothetical protein|nr:hypothetical protein [Prevotella sp.]
MAQASKKTKIIAICICLIVIIVCSVGYCYFLPSEIAFVFSGGVIGGTIPLSIFVYDMMKERKRKPNIKHQTAPVQIKPRMAVILKRCSVCAGDDMDAPHDGTLNVESVDDLVYHLEHYYLPRVLGDVRWLAYLYTRNGPVIFSMDIPLVGECKVYDVVPDSWLTDGVRIYIEYDCSKREK